jgi:hypothetical protein
LFSQEFSQKDFAIIGPVHNENKISSSAKSNEMKNAEKENHPISQWWPSTTTHWLLSRICERYHSGEFFIKDTIDSLIEKGKNKRNIEAKSNQAEMGSKRSILFFLLRSESQSKSNGKTISLMENWNHSIAVFWYSE